MAGSDSRSLRQKPQVSYTISDDSDSVVSASETSSPFSTPQAKRSHNFVDLDGDEDKDDGRQSRAGATERLSSAGHSLRPRSTLNLSLKAYENSDKKPLAKKRKLMSKASIKRTKAYIHSTGDDSEGEESVIVLQPAQSSRAQLRQDIAAETAARRSRFFVAKKEYFLPLLPENNHVQKLVDRLGADAGAIRPYEDLQRQPKGVKATMKPYQLSGLSFLLFLYENGLSGILGDEMGLGKTLQTLSLFQYLKEQSGVRHNSRQARPFLVVCPLSVLSSWISEARKWTPGLNILRYHGPSHERNRLKKVAEGKEDMFGNETVQSRRKKNERRTATGKPIISIDTDSEDDTFRGQGVDVVVTTYETFLAEQVWFKRVFVWHHVVLDEGHKIKNDLSQVSTALQGLNAEYRLILTGTPLQNNLVELWALLHWLYPEVFTERSAELFRSSFDLTRGKISTSVMDDSRRLLELIMMRRMKNSPGVDLNLPPKTDVLLYVPLTPMQRFWYTRLLTRADKGLLDELFKDVKHKETEARAQEIQEEKAWERKDIGELEILEKEDRHSGDGWEESKIIMQQALDQEEEDSSKKSAWRKLMNLLMQLRKCCNHPYLLPHAEPSPYFVGNHIITASGKFIVLDKLVQELVIKQGKKILIFSGFTRMLDCCEDFLSLRGGDGERFKYVRLDGGTARARRNLGIRMFNNEQSDYKVMLISTRAGGLGINLATASDVVMLDQDWNPQIMLQAEARAHRIGQTKAVTIYKLCTQGTVEEQMMGRIQKKLYLSAKVTESMRNIHTQVGAKGKIKGRPKGTTDDDVPHLDTTQLMSLVRRGAQTLSHPELSVDDMLGWDWETTLDKCKDKPSDLLVAEQTQSKPEVSDQEEQKWLSKMEQVESYVFNGKKYAKDQKIGNNSDIKEEWNRAERRQGKNTTVMVDGFAINKESMQCGDWEAVPTLAGKDPRLADVKRAKRAAINNQEKTSDAGGMIYRCRWCERGYCEDCLDWDKVELIGENLLEYELLGYPAVTQAFYICCPPCAEYHREDSTAREFCVNAARDYERLHKQMMDKQTATAAVQDSRNIVELPSRAESLTDATTVDDSGVSTPKLVGSKDIKIPRWGKYSPKGPKGLKATPVKILKG
ncbi:MAG: hypothetical protein M1836_007663 [Candelina mexicana]|nr:MAG: hypothetical protein M1836_007663 [Candelina mexicana]